MLNLSFIINHPAHGPVYVTYIVKNKRLNQIIFKLSDWGFSSILRGQSDNNHTCVVLCNTVFLLLFHFCVFLFVFCSYSVCACRVHLGEEGKESATNVLLHQMSNTITITDPRNSQKVYTLTHNNVHSYLISSKSVYINSQFKAYGNAEK